MDQQDEVFERAKWLSPLNIVGDEKEVNLDAFRDPNSNATSPLSQKKRPKWRKPAGKPHHPRTGYNLFFQFERNRILNQTDHLPITWISISDFHVNAVPPLKGPPLSLSRSKAPTKFGFAEMAKNVAAKWKTLNPDLKDMFERKAMEDKLRYKQELEKWNRVKNMKLEGPSPLTQHRESPSVERTILHLDDISATEAFNPDLNHSGMRQHSKNDGVFDFPSRINQNVFFFADQNMQASFMRYVMYGEMSGLLDRHWDATEQTNSISIRDFETSVASPPQLIHINASLPSLSYDHRFLPSYIGNLTEELLKSSSQLQEWMQEQIFSSNTLTFEQFQELDRRKLLCSDSVRQLLQYLRSVVSVSDKPSKKNRSSLPQGIPELSFQFEHGCNNEAAQSTVEQLLPHDDVHRVHKFHCPSKLHLNPAHGCRSSPRQALKGSLKTSHNNFPPDSTVDAGTIVQVPCVDTSYCHSSTLPPCDASHFLAKDCQNSVPLHDQVSSFGDSDGFANTANLRNLGPVVLEDRLSSITNTTGISWSCGEETLDFHDEMVATTGDSEDFDDAHMFNLFFT